MHDIDNLPGLIELGHLNEKGVCEIAFDVTDWLTEYPLGVLNVTYMRPGENTVYPVDVTGVSLASPTGEYLALTVVDDKHVLTWTVSDAVTYIAGGGSVVIELKEGTDVRKATPKVHTYVAEGHAAAGDPPEPLASYIEKWGAVDATVEGVSVGEEATATVTQDANGTHFAFVLPYIPI